MRQLYRIVILPETGSLREYCVGSGAEGVGKSLGYQDGDGGLGEEEVGESCYSPGKMTI
jgi:hypothetical protein